MSCLQFRLVDFALKTGRSIGFVHIQITDGVLDCETGLPLGPRLPRSLSRTRVGTYSCLFFESEQLAPGQRARLRLTPCVAVKSPVS